MLGPPGFYHPQLNSVDPDEATDFYVRLFRRHLPAPLRAFVDFIQVRKDE
jgi:hypothetical protein